MLLFISILSLFYEQSLIFWRQPPSLHVFKKQLISHLAPGVPVRHKLSKSEYFIFLVILVLEMNIAAMLIHTNHKTCLRNCGI